MEKKEELFKVNRHTDVDGYIEYSITHWDEKGYVGRTTDTVYSDGCSYTDWCVYVGTKDECEAFIKHSCQ